MSKRLGKVGVLTAKQRRFVEEYLVDLNATAAARRAGYSPRTADRIGSRLLRHPGVAALLAEHAARVGSRLNLTVERVEEELARVAYFDLRDLFDAHGRLLDVEAMPENARRAIAAIDVEELFEGRGKDREHVGIVRKLRFWSKPEALRLALQRLGALVERHEVAVNADARDVSDSEWEAMAVLMHRVRVAPEAERAGTEPPNVGTDG